MNKYNVGFLGDGATLHARLLDTVFESYLTNLQTEGREYAMRHTLLGTDEWLQDEVETVPGTPFPYGYPVEAP